MKKFTKDRYFISTAIPYTNSVPHIGFAMELIITDVLVRFLRMNGKKVFFSTGVDQHGQKNAEAAEKNGLTPLEFTNKMGDKFLKLCEKLHISHSKFVRTVDDYHKKASQKLWIENFKKDLIYKGSYSGLYCVGCEEYKLEKDLDENGNCPDHKKPPTEMRAENYFFKLSEFSDKIKELIETDQILVKPETRKNEMLSLCNEGLRDFSISREKSQLNWGIQVPNDENHVMYVWFDALTNYISSVGFPENLEEFSSWWESDDTYKIHIIGKGIHRFHLAYWPGMLLGGGHKTQDETFIHGFITSNGTKMSKSLGNVVDPFTEVEKYGVDAVRWYLMSQGNLSEDIDFTRERFESVYNTDLAGGIGNSLNRVLAIGKKLDGEAEEGNFSDNKILHEIYINSESLGEISENAFFDFNYRVLTESVRKILQKMNQYFDAEKPWEKSSEERKVIYFALGKILENVFFSIYPIIPSTSIKALKMLKNDGFEIKLSSLDQNLVQGAKTEKFLFPKLG